MNINKYTYKMKKIISLLVLAVLACTLCQAQNFAVINKNDKPINAIYTLKNDFPINLGKGTKVKFAVDFSEARLVRFENDLCTIKEDLGTPTEYFGSRGEQALESWPPRIYMMSKSACGYLHRTFGGDFDVLVKGEDLDNINFQYLVVARIGLLDFGRFVFIGGMKDGGTVTKGIVEVYEKDHGLVGVYDINYLRGLNVGYVNDDRLAEWGKCFAKEFKKTLGNGKK